MKRVYRVNRGSSCIARPCYHTALARTARMGKIRRDIPSPGDFYASEIDGLQEYRNGWAWGHCPFHADSNPSFTVNLDTGAFRCMSSSCGVSGSNIVSFVSQRDGLSYREARRFLEDWS